MTADPDRFSRSIIDVLARRAASRCSNPECRAITSGPAEDTARSVNLGEAAHIWGARPGAARYDARMTSAERSAISNGIWLCRNCHKIVDTDPDQYSTSLLIEWRQEHEQDVAANLGKTSNQFQRQTSYLARQIIIDKPYGWEYRLTAELLRSKLTPVLSRGHALARGLYTKPVTRLSEQSAIGWLQDRIAEIRHLIQVLAELIYTELQKSWETARRLDSPEVILQTCCLLEEACQRLLSWEESVRFTILPNEYKPIGALFAGIGNRFLDRIGTIPEELGKIFTENKPSGTFNITIALDFPVGWGERCNSELQVIERKYASQ